MNSAERFSDRTSQEYYPDDDNKIVTLLTCVLELVDGSEELGYRNGLISEDVLRSVARHHRVEGASPIEMINVSTDPALGKILVNKYDEEPS